jgi:hypothetical protein
MFTICSSFKKILLKGGSPAIEQSPGPHSETVKAWRWKFPKKDAGNTAHLNIKGDSLKIYKNTWWGTNYPWSEILVKLFYAAPNLATLQPWANQHTPELYTAVSYWAMLHPTEL